MPEFMDKLVFPRQNMLLPDNAVLHAGHAWPGWVASPPLYVLLAHDGCAGQHCISTGRKSLHCHGKWPETADAGLWLECRACPGERLEMSPSL